STSTLKASSIRARWRLCGPMTARNAAALRDRNSDSRAMRSPCWVPSRLAGGARLLGGIVSVPNAARAAWVEKNPSVRLDQSARQAVLLAADDLDRKDPADQLICVLDVDRLQIGRAADGLGAVAALLLEQHRQDASGQRLVEGDLLLGQQGLKGVQTRLGHGVRNLDRHRR